jgi:hypothetical protein
METAGNVRCIRRHTPGSYRLLQLFHEFRQPDSPGPCHYQPQSLVFHPQRSRIVPKSPDSLKFRNKRPRLVLLDFWRFGRERRGRDLVHEEVSQDSDCRARVDVIVKYGPECLVWYCEADYWKRDVVSAQGGDAARRIGRFGSSEECGDTRWIGRFGSSEEASLDSPDVLMDWGEDSLLVVGEGKA